MGTKRKFVIQDVAGGHARRELDAPSQADYLGWMPDGRALTYLLTEKSAQNLYMLPLSGGKPVRLIHYDDERRKENSHHAIAIQQHRCGHVYRTSAMTVP